MNAYPKYRRHGDEYVTTADTSTYEDNLPIKDLLHKQSKGKFLNPKEKERVKKYAEEQRKKKNKKRK